MIDEEADRIPTTGKLEGYLESGTKKGKSDAGNCIFKPHSLTEVQSHERQFWRWQRSHFGMASHLLDWTHWRRILLFRCACAYVYVAQFTFTIAQHKHKHKHKKKENFPFSCAYAYAYAYAYVTPVHTALACAYAYVYAYVICVNQPSVIIKGMELNFWLFAS